MAKEEVAISVTVDTANTGKSLKDLKKEFKELQSELSGLDRTSKRYTETLKRLGETKDEIGLLNDQINAFADDAGKINAVGNVVQGLAGGFAAAQGAAALFGSENEELQKTLVKVQGAMALQQGLAGLKNLGDGFKVLGTIIKANPLMLLVTILTAIGAAAFALKDKVKILGDIFDAVGNAIGFVVDAIKEFTDWIGISSFALDEATEKQVEAMKTQSDAIQGRYDKEIKLAQAAGKNTAALEVEKQKAIIQTAVLETKLLKQTYELKGELTEEERTRLKELVKIVSDASTEIQVINIKEKTEANKLQEEKTKKWIEENKKKEIAEREFQQKVFDEWMKSIQKRKTEEERIRKENEDRIKAQEEVDATRINNNLERLALEEEQAKALKDYRLQEYRDEMAQRIQLESDAINSVQALSDIAFAIRLKNVKKGSAEEERLAKQSFKINKALAISSSTINSIESISAYLKKNPLLIGGVPNPGAIAGLAALVTTNAANIVKIASTQFNGGGSGGDTPTAGAVSIEAPRINTPTQGSTELNANGTVKQQGNNSQVFKAIVVETDITKTQKRVKTLETNSKF